MENIVKAMPKKLRDGSWGALVENTTVAIGDKIKIRTRAGKEWTAIVTRIQECSVYHGHTIVAKRDVGRNAVKPVNRSTRTGCTCGSIEEYEKKSDCWQCRHDRW